MRRMVCRASTGSAGFAACASGIPDLLVEVQEAGFVLVQHTGFNQIPNQRREGGSSAYSGVLKS